MPAEEKRRGREEREEKRNMTSTVLLLKQLAVLPFSHFLIVWHVQFVVFTGVGFSAHSETWFIPGLISEEAFE